MNPAYLLAEVAAEQPEFPAVLADEGQLSYAELQAATQRLAGGLRSLGLEPDARLAVLADNCLDWVLLYYAAAWAGLVFAPLDPRLRAPEIQAILADLEPHAMVVPAQVPEEVTQAAHETLGDKPVISLAQSSPQQGPLSLAALKEAAPLAEPTPRGPEDDSAILYTSGTTGTPRGAVLPFRVWDFFNIALEQWNNFPLQRAWLLFAPVSHISGPLYCNGILHFRSSLAMVPCLRPTEFIEKTQRYRPVISSVVPSVLTMLLKVSEERELDLSCYELLAAFGAPTPPDLRMKFEERFNLRLHTGYGLTEVAPLVSLTPKEIGMSRPYCVGRITPGVQVKIVDEEGTELGPEEIGEIIIAGDNVMKGYWRNPQQTAEVLRDGWFYTGDLGKLDAEGLLYVMGRKKDMIIVGGHNVYAAEVESVLLRHPAVAQVAVLGVTDKIRGEAVKAVVVPHRGRQVSAVELAELARKYLASYKVPRVFEFRESLPVSRTGKINKQELREQPLYEEWVT